MKIPLENLSDEVLMGIIEDYVLREGTDYGPIEQALADKCRMVKRQLEAGQAMIDFDPASETIDIRLVEDRS